MVGMIKPMFSRTARSKMLSIYESALISGTSNEPSETWQAEDMRGTKSVVKILTSSENLAASV